MSWEERRLRQPTRPLAGMLARLLVGWVALAAAIELVPGVSSANWGMCLSRTPAGGRGA